MKQAYEGLIGQGRLKPDGAQAAIAERLHALAEALSAAQARGLSRLLSPKPRQAPAGLYLWGDVGRGKTMLMDLFFAEVRLARKRRVHFHAFMQDIHARVHQARAKAQGPDVIGPVAKAIAKETQLLCLDEFQVEDITDAMLLGRLFEALLASGLTIVTTSNTPPERLYENGLNRQLFEPFIRLIQSRFEVLSLNSPTDYRLGRMAGRRVFITPPDPAEMEALWAELTDGAPGSPAILPVKGRELLVPRAAHGAAWFSFAQLCEAAVGSADYAALADRFGTLFLEGLPRLPRERRNEARRFTLLIDTLYDRHLRLVVSAEAPAEALGLAPRTLSRLQEMGSVGWWQGASAKKKRKT